MCGIAGYAGTHDPALLLAMTRTLAHRGPDDEGTWTDATNGAGLGHRRLSIIDLSPAGHQPMFTPTADLGITYNGEIYDFQRHRETLQRDGARFASGTDTEVFLRLYERHGPTAFSMVNGMFAVAFWDGRS